MKRSPYKKHSIYQPGVVIFFMKQLGIPVSTLHTAEKTLMLLRNMQINVDTPPLPLKKASRAKYQFILFKKIHCSFCVELSKDSEFHK
jgi:hypothetical protein